VKILLAVSLMAAAIAVGAESPGDWQQRKRGSVTWSARSVVDPAAGLCQHPAVDCRKIVVEVRNDHGDAPVFCGASIQFPQPNAYAMHEKGWREWLAIEPGKTAPVNFAWVPKDLEVEAIHTECHATRPVLTANAIMDVTDKPPQPPPPPRVPPVACSTRMQHVANIEQYYPAEARREERQGAPVVRITVKKGESEPDSVMLVTSSNHADLDQAAIEVAKASKYVTSCEVGSLMFKVKFYITVESST
jgi:TonB family protein